MEKIQTFYKLDEEELRSFVSISDEPDNNAEKPKRYTTFYIIDDETISEILKSECIDTVNEYTTEDGEKYAIDDSESNFKVINGELKAYNGKSKAVVIPSSVKEPDAAVSELTRKKDIRYVRYPDSFIPSAYNKNREVSLTAKNLEYIDVSDNNPVCCSVNGLLFSRDRRILYRCPDRKKLSLYVVPDETEIISAAAFRGNKYLNKIIITSGTKEIGEEAFKKCTSLRTIRIREGLKNIGDSAFTECNKLSVLNLPASLEYVSPYAFYRANALKEINVEPKNSLFRSESGVLFNKDMTELIYYPCDRSNKSYVIPATVRTVRKDAFLGSRHLEVIDVTLCGNNFTSAGEIQKWGIRDKKQFVVCRKK